MTNFNAKNQRGTCSLYFQYLSYHHRQAVQACTTRTKSSNCGSTRIDLLNFPTDVASFLELFVGRKKEKKKMRTRSHGKLLERQSSTPIINISPKLSFLVEKTRLSFAQKKKKKKKKNLGVEPKIKISRVSGLYKPRGRGRSFAGVERRINHRGAALLERGNKQRRCRCCGNSVVKISYVSLRHE